MRMWTGVIAVFVLIVPTPPAPAKSIMTGVCGDPGVRVVLAVKSPSRGDQHDNCKKGCHAANDRKRRSDGSVKDEGCC